MPAATAARQGPRPAQNANDKTSLAWTVLKYAGLYFGIQIISSIALRPESPIGKFIGRQAPGPSSGGDVAKEVPVPAVQPQTAGMTATALWSAGDDMTCSVFLSTGETNGPRLPFHRFEPVKYGDWAWSQSWETEFHVPTSVQQNGTLYAEIYLARNGATLDTSDPLYNINNVAYTRKLLSRYAPQRKIRAVKNLLTAANDTAPQSEAPEDVTETSIISYYHPNLTIAVCNEPNFVLSYAALPAPLARYTLLSGELPDKSDPNKRMYYPTIFGHDFWLLKEHMNPINESVTTLPLRVDFQPISQMKFQVFGSLDASFQEASAKGTGGEMDEIKRMLLETNPILLVTTFIVTILHTVFEFLAFSNDVSHWRKKKELVGVSVRTILTNVFVQLIILLYLLDNNENTSWMILGSQGIGLVIEAWKITKAVDIKLLPSNAGLLPYKIEVHDKHVLSSDEIKTQEYDKLAFKIVGWGTAPFLVGYTIYSLLYQTHRGWYSFVISTLTSFVYMFGFVQLIPQLIINYKLKSVAHLPMKSLVYKTLTTVVDDFFSLRAFYHCLGHSCIRMPLLHRLACFRDDVVFCILMYQKWLYRVDPTRVNEYGQGGDPAALAAVGGDEAKEKKEQ